MNLRILFPVLLLAIAAHLPANAAEESIASPDGRIVVLVDDTDSLHYRVTFDGQPALTDSKLGFDFEGGFSLGRQPALTRAVRSEHDEMWDNPFGQRRSSRDYYRELKLELREHADAPG